jgi:hypothetical protein
MNEKANYFTFTVPEKIQNGRHMMVWSWAWKASLLSGTSGNNSVYDVSWDNAWGTCFDLVIQNSTFTGLFPPPSLRKRLLTYITDEYNTDILANDPNYDSSAAAEEEANEICSETCYRGGMTSNPCTGSDCPPCWYKSDGVVTCYDYTSGTTCPWTGAYDCKLGKTSSKKRDLVASHHFAHKHRRNL